MGHAFAVFAIVSSFILFLIGLIGIIFGEKFIHGFVASNIRLEPSTDLYKQWLSPSIDVYLSIYIFNLKNPSEFQNGSKPLFEEIGPFVFKEIVVKEDLVDNLNYTISYREKKQYYFIQEMSPYEFDYPITTLNMGPITVINGIKYSSKIVQNAVNLALKATGDTLLVEKMPARDLLFGYKDKFLVQLKKVLPNLVPTDTVGLFIDKNNTFDGLYTIYTGADDYNKVGLVEKYNRQNKLNSWTTKYANMINGTDGTILPPFVNESSIIYIFNSDLCRSLYTVYNKTITLIDGIKVLGFAPNEYFYENYTINPDNAGFCTPSDNCLPKGLLNLTDCVGGVPIIMSCPHFLYSEEKFIKEVYGLSPVYKDHATELFIEPTTGLLMKANKRIQFNTQLYHDQRISMTKKIPEVMYPLFWVDEHFEIDKKNADTFYYQVKLPLMLISIGKYVLSVLGFILFVISCIYAYSLSTKTEQTQDLNIQSDETREPTEQTPLII
ncbi:unnamed protein product [Brachionus calyciflorus]|uniref:Uncharacterized protein n=1 Tax=Brachionus calyciflorus TaxID=104777 RepID=A0A814BL02_9BILA|nr:unnamed protein product [Brachionus calyciflorus]